MIRPAMFLALVLMVAIFDDLTLAASQNEARSFVVTETESEKNGVGLRSRVTNFLECGATPGKTTYVYFHSPDDCTQFPCDTVVGQSYSVQTDFRFPSTTYGVFYELSLVTERGVVQQRLGHFEGTYNSSLSYGFSIGWTPNGKDALGLVGLKMVFSNNYNSAKTESCWLGSVNIHQ